MNWLHRHKRERTRYGQSELASGSELQAVFAAEYEDLYWRALVITGEPQLARQSVVNAGQLASSNTGVFRDWLVRWARSTIARVAAESVREQIIAVAGKYVNWTCSHSDHLLFSAEQVASLRRVDALQCVADLNPLERAVLVLRGIQRASIPECALLLTVSNRCVIGAYCCVLQCMGRREYTPITHRIYTEDAHSAQRHYFRAAT